MFLTFKSVSDKTYFNASDCSELDQPKRKEKPRKGGGSGLTAPLPLSDALVNFFGTGESELSRADVVKKMWQYIKENELQVFHSSWSLHCFCQ